LELVVSLLDDRHCLVDEVAEVVQGAGRAEIFALVLLLLADGVRLLAELVGGQPLAASAAAASAAGGKEESRGARDYR
jgi:hypothetical protein